MDAPVSAQRSLNLFPRRVEIPSGKASYSLEGVPGFEQFADLSSFAAAESMIFADGRLFAISDTYILEISSSGTPTNLGNITAGTDQHMAYNGTHLIFTANGGTNVYSLQLSDNAVTPVTTNISGGIVGFHFLDGYIIAAETGTQNFFISALRDVSAWSTLDFTQVEAHPDDIVDQIVDKGEYIAMGTDSIQVYRNTGNFDFPFEPVPGGRIEYGVLPGSIVRNDNSVFVIAKDARGGLSVYRMEGYTPIRISTHPVEDSLNTLVNPTSCKCFSYSEKGHAFYVIAEVTPESGSSLTVSWAYDSSTGLWHERGHWSTSETFTELGIVSYVNAFGKHLVAHAGFTGIYEMDDDILNDALAPVGNSSDEIKWLRRSPHIVGNNHNVSFPHFELDGNGIASYELKVSFDGGATYGSALTAPSLGRYRISGLGAVEIRSSRLRESLTEVIRYTLREPTLTRL